MSSLEIVGQDNLLGKLEPPYPYDMIGKKSKLELCIKEIYKNSGKINKSKIN